MQKKLINFIVLVVLHLCCCISADAATSVEFQSALTRQLNCFPLQLVNVNNQEISISNEELCLAAIYTATGMKPLWVSEAGPNEKAAAILQVLENAETEGLRANDYNIAEVKSLWKRDTPGQLAQLETQLTLNFIKYAHDVSQGRIIPFKADPKLFAEAGDSHFKPVQIIEEALAAPDIVRYLTDLPPSNEYYRKLRTALQFYRNIARTSDREKIVDGQTLHPGDLDDRVKQVRHYFIQTGDLDLTTENDPRYDEQLVPVIKKLQKQFGLEEDGIIGRKTLAALNTTPEEIVNKIILNMARWRWQEHKLGQRYIMINIANYDLKAVNNGQEILEMAVIVGKLQHQTPVFSDRIQYIDFNPFWNIPPSIARNEELPELRKDRFYLVNRQVRLFSNWQDDGVELDSTAIDWQSITPREMNRYKLRQDPGPWNALGPVKLVFPNKMNVYIHGTPAQELFEHNKRNFSHGCIRASQPLALVKFALSEEKKEWSMEEIQEIITLGKRKVVNLSIPLPVHITYQTVWVDNLGIIHFNEDTYDRDRKLAEILFTSTVSGTSTTRNATIHE